jgi:hypothetical protein
MTYRRNFAAGKMKDNIYIKSDLSNEEICSGHACHGFLHDIMQRRRQRSSKCSAGSVRSV